MHGWFINIVKLTDLIISNLMHFGLEPNNRRYTVAFIVYVHPCNATDLQTTKTRQTQIASLDLAMIDAGISIRPRSRSA